MKRYSERRIRLVTRSTRLEELVVRYNTATQAKFAIESAGGSFTDIELEHKTYLGVKAKVTAMLDGLGRLELIDRKYVPSYVFGPDDLVICLGQDGLVANVLKYLPTQHVLGINPDPTRWDGLLLRSNLTNLESIGRLAVDAKITARPVCLAEVELNDGQIIRAVNDLFIGVSNHSSARYVLEFDAKRENQSSSGIVISTGLGSTGWYSSLRGGALALAGFSSQSGDVDSDTWDYSKPELRFTVREPFRTQTTGNSLMQGIVDEHAVLKIESRMGDGGVIFSDGMQSDFVEFNAGSVASIKISNQNGWLLEPQDVWKT